MRGFLLISSLAALLFQSACGYSLYNSKNPNARVLDEQGIRKIYVKPLVNNTYKPGVENVVYNELVKSLNSFRRIQLVTDEKEADAVLSGTVGSADYAPAASAPFSNLYPLGRGSTNREAAIRYTANLNCGFTLAKRNPGGGMGTQIWSGSLSRVRDFPGNNQIGMYGATSPLINDSEFDRALKEMAQSMMGDLNEYMLNRF